MSVKTFFNNCYKIIKAPFIALIYLGKGIAKGLAYIYKACDFFVAHLVSWGGAVTTGLQKKNRGTKEHKVAKLTLYAITFIVILIIVIYILSECVFFVPVGGGAVVTRFGAVNRDVGMGMHFRIPFVERYYIIQLGFIKEETFGFMQVEPPLRHQRLTTQERTFQTQYEKELLSREADNDVFAEKGDIASSVNQRQRLTHDYLREMGGRKRYLTVDQTLQMLQRNQQELQHLQQQGVTPNGRIPLEKESKIITKDLNIIRVSWSVQYRIDNMQDYLFHSRDVQENIRDISLAAMSEVIGRSHYDKVMTTDRDRVEQQVEYLLQNEINKLKLGVKITQVIILDALPVKEVQFAFDEVNKAAQDKERYIYMAQREYQRRIPAAKGQAQKIKADAQAYATNLKLVSEGKAKQFDSVLQAYKLYPAITNDRLYIDAMSTLMGRTPTMIIDPKIQGVLPVFTGGQMNPGNRQEPTGQLNTMKNLSPLLSAEFEEPVVQANNHQVQANQQHSTANSQMAHEPVPVPSTGKPHLITKTAADLRSRGQPEQ